MKSVIKGMLLVLSFIVVTNVYANNESIKQTWSDAIGSDYYQDIYRYNDKIYILSKNQLFIYDSDGNKKTVKLEACDQGTFYNGGFICYNYSSENFLKDFDQNPRWQWYLDHYTEEQRKSYIEDFYWKEEYVYDYDFSGKLINKVLAYEGTVNRSDTKLAGLTNPNIDFDYISKYNGDYYFFSQGELTRIVSGSEENVYCKEVTSIYPNMECADIKYIYYDDDWDSYGWYDYTNYQWQKIDIDNIYESAKRPLDEKYIYNYFYDKYSNGYSYPMIYSNLGDWYYVGYLDMSKYSYMALVHNSKTGKDIDIKINGTSFFSVILGDNYFLVLDTTTDTCDSSECKTTTMTKYDYEGNIIDTEDIISSSTSFMGTSVGYMYGDGFAVIAGTKDEGKTSYTTSLLKFEKSPFKVETKDAKGGDVKVSRNVADYLDTITFTVTPDSGYLLDKVLVTDSNGKTIEFTDYTFTMPKADVTIEAVFKKKTILAKI